MIKIEVRKDGVYNAGYPYNAPVDEYFRNLTEDFIKNYGLSSDAVAGINKHKNDTGKFDLDIHEFIFKLSAFIRQFDIDGQKIIDEYEVLKAEEQGLLSNQSNLEQKRSVANEEFAFVVLNVERLETDIKEIINIINYYQGKVVEDTSVYNDSYIEETNSALAVLVHLLGQIDASYAHNFNSLEEIVTQLVVVKQETIDNTFKATALRSMFEEWKKRPEEYYRKLVEYFQVEYDTYWTYGTSMVYGQRLIKEKVVMEQYVSVADKLQEEVFKKYSFKLDEELKRYSLVWLSAHESFDLAEFKYDIENKKIELLRRDVAEIDILVRQKNNLVNNIMVPVKYANYNKYKEFVLEKIKYIINNINSTIDATVLQNLDSKIMEIESNYVEIHARFAQSTYWTINAEKEMYSTLLVELNRRLANALSTVGGGFTPLDIDNTATLQKIELYTAEKNALNKKIFDLRFIKDKIKLDVDVYNDELSLLTSKIYENSESLTQKISEYIVFFDERVPFFTQNITVSETDGIIGLLNGNFFRGFDDYYNEFEKYTHPIKWYIENDRNKLKKLYKRMLDIINIGMLTEWNREFSHEILNTKKHTIYGEYIMRELKLMFSSINKHVLDSVYVVNYIDGVKEQSNKVKDIFKIYARIGFALKKNISVNTDVFDYSKILEFDIENGGEMEQNVLDTFNDIVDNIVTFTYNKNLEFRDIEAVVDNQQKIDRAWLDMEKKYV